MKKRLSAAVLGLGLGLGMVSGTASALQECGVLLKCTVDGCEIVGFFICD